MVYVNYRKRSKFNFLFLCSGPTWRLPLRCTKRNLETSGFSTTLHRCPCAEHRFGGPLRSESHSLSLRRDTKTQSKIITRNKSRSSTTWLHFYWDRWHKVFKAWLIIFLTFKVLLLSTTIVFCFYYDHDM